MLCFVANLCCCYQVDGVCGIHEFHVWQLAGNRIVATAHIRCRALHDYARIAEQVKIIFHNGGIHSTTVQPEFIEVHYYIYHLTSVCPLGVRLSGVQPLSTEL